MRRFYLENEYGDRVGLNNETGIFLTEPSGLGLEFSDSFADIGEGFFKLTNKGHQQKTISCKINFVGANPYTDYNKFITWCMKSKELYLVYGVPIFNNTEQEIQYYIHVEIANIQKGEINLAGYLEAPANFLYLSPWYLPTPVNPVNTGLIDEAFRFNLKRFDIAPLAPLQIKDYEAIIEPQGHLPAAFEVEYTGVIHDPVIKLVGVTGKEYGRCEITQIVNVSTTKITLSTKYDNPFVKMVTDKGVETNLLPKVNLIYNPFFKMPVNEKCRLTVEDSGSMTGKLNIKVFYYFRSV